MGCDISEALKAEETSYYSGRALTNIAIALLKYDDLYKHIERISIMGGSTKVGNVRPYSEFNIYVDPFAADVVFKSGVPVTMVGLNVTMETVLTPDLVNELKQIDSSVNKEVATAFRPYGEYV